MDTKKDQHSFLTNLSNFLAELISFSLVNSFIVYTLYFRLIVSIVIESRRRFFLSLSKEFSFLTEFFEERSYCFVLKFTGKYLSLTMNGMQDNNIIESKAFQKLMQESLLSGHVKFTEWNFYVIITGKHFKNKTKP